MARLDDSGVGDKERAIEMKSLSELARAFDGPPSEHDTRARLKVEGNHLL